MKNLVLKMMFPLSSRYIMKESFKNNQRNFCSLIRK